LQNAYTVNQKRLDVLPKLQQKQQQLERQLQVARTIYEELLKRSQEVEVVVNQNVGNARVVSTALVPNKANEMSGSDQIHQLK
jgi:succinoglycan biosynthesis transport protein ExoP